MHHDDRLAAWQTVIELAESGAASAWTLVGGLMVAAHARRAGVVMRRPTDDVDALVDYATNQASLIEARTTLARLGFELSRDDTFAYRFVHADGRKRIKATTDLLADQTHASWANLDDPERRRGHLNLVLIRRTLGIAAG